MMRERRIPSPQESGTLMDHGHQGQIGDLATGDDRTTILLEVAIERARQDAKWGGVPGIDRRDDRTYAAVLGEEFGECCKAWLERDVAALRVELIQTAAVAVAWIEELDNGGALPRQEA